MDTYNLYFESSENVLDLKMHKPQSNSFDNIISWQSSRQQKVSVNRNSERFRFSQVSFWDNGRIVSQKSFLETWFVWKWNFVD